MFNFLILNLLLVWLYVALIYTSTAMLLAVISGLVLWGIMTVYVIFLRFFLLGRIKIPIGVAEPGQPVTLRFEIRNRLPFTVSRIRLCVRVSDSFEQTGKKLWLKVTGLMPGENQAQFTITLEHPGNYEFHLCRIRFYDPVGLLRGTGRLDSRKNLQILPGLFPVPVNLTARVKHFFGDADVYDQEKAGHDNSEIFQIREYRPGDKLQGIHWKLSAKTDQLMVRENSLPRSCAVVIFLEEDPGQWRRGYRFYQFLETAASISFSLMDSGCPHYMVWYEEKTLDVTRARVDDEESFYQFLAWYLTDQGKEKPKNLPERYREKYRGEYFVYRLEITGDLRLILDGQPFARLTPEGFAKELGGMELVF